MAGARRGAEGRGRAGHRRPWSSRGGSRPRAGARRRVTSPRRPPQRAWPRPNCGLTASSRRQNTSHTQPGQKKGGLALCEGRRRCAPRAAAERRDRPSAAPPHQARPSRGAHARSLSLSISSPFPPHLAVRADEDDAPARVDAQAAEAAGGGPGEREEKRERGRRVRQTGARGERGGTRSINAARRS